MATRDHSLTPIQTTHYSGKSNKLNNQQQKTPNTERSVILETLIYFISNLWKSCKIKTSNMLHQSLIPSLQTWAPGYVWMTPLNYPNDSVGRILNSKPDLLWVSHSMRSQYFSISPCEQRVQKTIIQSRNGNKILWWKFMILIGS